MRHGWSLSPASWEAASAAVGAEPWRHVAFQQRHRRLVPEASGIYMLGTLPAASALPDRLYNAVYVGQARNLRNRFLQHLHSPGPEVLRAGLCFRHLDFWFMRAEQTSLDHI